MQIQAEKNQRQLINNGEEKLEAGLWEADNCMSSKRPRLAQVESRSETCLSPLLKPSSQTLDSNCLMLPQPMKQLERDSVDFLINSFFNVPEALIDDEE